MLKDTWGRQRGTNKTSMEAEPRLDNLILTPAIVHTMKWAWRWIGGELLYNHSKGLFPDLSGRGAGSGISWKDGVLAPAPDQQMTKRSRYQKPTRFQQRAFRICGLSTDQQHRLWICPSPATKFILQEIIFSQNFPSGKFYPNRTLISIQWSSFNVGNLRID